MKKNTLTVFLVFFTAFHISFGAQAGEGQEAYKRCVACHQSDGGGIPGMFPALKGRMADIMTSVEGRDYVTMVLISGLIGAIKVDGQRFIGAMPAQDMSNAQISAVIEYTLTGFGASDAVDSKLLLSEAEVAEIRSKYSNADSQTTPAMRRKVPALTEKQ